MSKTAIVLFNLGGPDSKESIRPFLYNFFMDYNIVRLPVFFRWLLAQWISVTRSKGAALKSYEFLGFKSPLLENSTAQGAALEKILNMDGGNFKTFISMRYWNPDASEGAKAVKAWDPDRIVLLPLYPQFSTTTTRSSFGTWKKAAQDAGLFKPTSTICCYPFNEGFIKASAKNILAVYEQAIKDGHKNPRVLFSAHGLPKSIITDGDSYQWQCEQTAQKIVHDLNIPDLDWTVCYQSRVGKQEWIGPSTEEELFRAGKTKTPVIIYPHAFTQEHVETLVEIEIEYREFAHEQGIPGFYRVPTVSTHPDFIEGLARMVRDRMNIDGVHADGFLRICPGEFKRCCMQN